MTAPHRPGQTHLGSRIASIDAQVDHWFAPLRRIRTVNSTMRAASFLGDWSLIWHLCGVTRALVVHDLSSIVTLSLLLGLESLIVNQGVKRLFKRQRPTIAGGAGLHVRQPRTSSFPSGHASAATFAAIVLSNWTGGGWIVLWISLAVLVATSRIHVQIHHASDILGGVVAGAVLAAVAVTVM